jgi:hypothetical protein
MQVTVMGMMKMDCDRTLFLRLRVEDQFMDVDEKGRPV